MSNIIKKFGDWQKIYENDVPGRERERGDQNNKVVAIPVDKTTLKLKIVNDADVINAQGQLTVSGFDAILNWIKGQREIINYYSALNDLTNNVVIYSVQKDNARKQLVIFKIYSKTELRAQDPSAKGIDPRVRFIGQSELGSALGGKVLNVAGNLSPVTLDQVSGNKPGQPGPTPTTKADFNLPVKAASIIGSSDARLIKFITTAYNKVKKDPAVTNQPVLAKVKEEVKVGTLGANSALFVKALNAGFGIMDAQFGEETEVDVTQVLYDKIMAIPESKSFYLGLDAQRIVEAESTVIKGFDIDLFLAALKTVQVDTGGIKVPQGGFKEGMQNDPELKKFQDVLKKKLAKNLANHATYQKFAKAGAKGFQGNYGPLTKDLVYLLKAIAENPPYPNRDGSTIEPEFVNLVMAIKESTGSSYLGLDGRTFIYEDFNFGQANVVAPSPGSGGSGGGSRSRGRSSDASVEKKAKNGTEQGYELASKPDYIYKLVNNIVHYRKKGSSGNWIVNTNPVTIKEFVKDIAKVDGLEYAYALIGRDSSGTIKRLDQNKYAYKDKKWKVWLNNRWMDTTEDIINKLNAFYGSTPDKAQVKKSASKIIGTKAIDEELVTLVKSIKTFVETPGRFEAYVGGVNDDEQGAWDEMLEPEWTDNWKPKLGAIIKKVKEDDSIKESDKIRYSKSFAAISGMFKDKSFPIMKTVLATFGIPYSPDPSFYNTFMGAEYSDKYEIKLLLSGSNVVRFKIQCDFE